MVLKSEERERDGMLGRKQHSVIYIWRLMQDRRMTHALIHHVLGGKVRDAPILHNADSLGSVSVSESQGWEWASRLGQRGMS